MIKKKRSGPTAEQYIKTTVAMIDEKGGSRNVNLRSISRRMGHAHTNAYNYFADFRDLLWAAYRRALEIYAAFLANESKEAESDLGYLRGIFERLSRFPFDHPGLSRFIGSDPLPIEEMPADIMDSIGGMRRWFVDIILAMTGSGLEREEADRAASILLAYIAGETQDALNGRVLPEEDIPGRIVGNAMHLFDLLTGGCGTAAGGECSDIERTRDFPELVL